MKKPLRILWTVNVILPAYAARGNLGKPSGSGGWLVSMLDKLRLDPSYHLGVAMLSDRSDVDVAVIEGITYYALPRRAGDRFDVAEAECVAVLSDFSPDILHVHGTEMRFSRRFLELWNGANLVSIQGILNGLLAYELGRLPLASMIASGSPKLIATSLALLYNVTFRFAPRLQHERRTFERAKNVAGRTLWDSAHAANLAPQAKYHSCGEILREPFYKGRWSSDDIDSFSLFIPNGLTPRKGAHFAIRALALLKRDYPEVKLHIGGEHPDQIMERSFRRYIGYTVYLRYLISSLGLVGNVEFTGMLSATSMVERLKRTHVYLMPSLIENSSNSLAEAMIVGTPVVCSYSGGSPSMATDEREALFYRADDAVMLAHQVRRIFSNDGLARRLSMASQRRAAQSHDPDFVCGQLTTIYQQIADSLDGQ